MLRVKYERLRRGWTQTDVAARIGVTTGRISEYERGKLRAKKPGRAMRDLARLFAVEPYELFEPVRVPEELAGLGEDVWAWRRHGYWVR